MSEITALEMATLRLTAFRDLKGWGQTRENGEFKTWDLNELRERAIAQTDWALGRTRCGMCDKHSGEVKKLIAGVHTAICDECVALSAEILAEETNKPPAPETPASPVEAS